MSQYLSRLRVTLLVSALVTTVALFVPADALAVQNTPAVNDAPRFKWWQNESIQRKLGLTGDQSQRLEEVFQSALPDLRRGKRQLDTLESELARLVESSADDITVAQQVDRVEAARGVLNKTRTLMLLRMRRMLSADQRHRLDAFHKERARDHSHPDKRR